MTKVNQNVLISSSDVGIKFLSSSWLGRECPYSPALLSDRETRVGLTSLEAFIACSEDDMPCF